MIRCNKCGEQVPDGSAFCNHCGTPISTEVQCPSCQAHIPANSVFCPKCGKMVRNDMIDDEPTQKRTPAPTYHELHREPAQPQSDPWRDTASRPATEQQEAATLSSEPAHYNRNVLIGAAVVAAIIVALLLLRTCGNSGTTTVATGSDSTLLVTDTTGDATAVFWAEMERHNLVGDGAKPAGAVKIDDNRMIGIAYLSDATSRSFYKIYELNRSGNVWDVELRDAKYINGRGISFEPSALITDISQMPRGVDVNGKDCVYFAYMNTPGAEGTTGRVSLCLYDVEGKKVTTLDYDGPIKTRDDGRRYIYGKPLQRISSPETRFLQSEAQNVKIIYFPTAEELRAEQEALEKEEEEKKLADPDNADARWSQENDSLMHSINSGKETKVKTATYDKPIFNLKDMHKKIENEGYIVFSDNKGAVYGFNKDTRKYFTIYSPKKATEPTDIGFADSKNNLLRYRTATGRYSYDLVSGHTKRIE